MNEFSAYERLFVRLALTAGMDVSTFNLVLAVYVDLEEFFADIKSDKCRIKLSDAVLARLKRTDADIDYDGYIDTLNKKHIQIITRLHSEYPMYLREIIDAPSLLFVKGTLQNMTDKMFTIVGTRDCSQKGYDVAKSIAADLAKAGVCIVSGMARGADAAAHTGALEASGVTFAVMPGGVDVIYPKENAKLYDRIVENGAVLSEFPPGAKALPSHFEPRNRIVSGLSVGTLVIESSSDGGSSITARHALLQGRDVFVSKHGAPFIKNEELINALIESGCTVVSSAQQILREYGWGEAAEREYKKLSLDFFEERLYNLLLKGELTVDDMSLALNIDINELITTLTMMELNGVVKRRAGGIYSIA